MDGIRLTGQTLFSEDLPEKTLQQMHSIFVSKDMQVQRSYDGITAEGFLNTVEISVHRYQNGTTITVNHGITMIGAILTIVGLIAFLILGLVVILLWYMKYDDLRCTLKSSFPAFIPPPSHAQQFTYPPSGGY